MEKISRKDFIDLIDEGVCLLKDANAACSCMVSDKKMIKTYNKLENFEKKCAKKFSLDTKTIHNALLFIEEHVDL